MKNINFAFIFSLALFIASAASAQNADNHPCRALGDNLYNCKAFKCDTSLPDAKDKIIHNTIVGYNKDGECVHEQMNPDGEKVTCHYSEESRKFLALRMKKAQTDLTNMPQSSEFEENILADIFQNECEVRSKDGKLHKVEEETDDNSQLEENTGEVESDTNDGMDETITPKDDGEIAPLPDKLPENGDLLDQ